MNIEKVKYSAKYNNVISFKADENKVLNTEPKADKEKSNAMLKMLGLTALGAAAIGGIIYALKSGNTSKVTQGGGNEIPELLKKIFRKDGSLLKTIEKDKDGKLISEKVFAKDGKTLKIETLYDNGQKVGTNVFADGKPKFSYILTSEDNGYLKMEYDYKSGNLISDIVLDNKLQARNIADMETGIIYRSTEFDKDKRPVVESFMRRKDGKIYETNFYDYLSKDSSVEVKHKVVKYNPDTGFKTKEIDLSREGILKTIFKYKNGCLREKMIMNADGSVFAKDTFEAGVNTRRIIYENGKIKKITNSGSDIHNQMISEIYYENGKPVRALKYENGFKKSELTYDANGIKTNKKVYNEEGKLETEYNYSADGLKTEK